MLIPQNIRDIAGEIGQYYLNKNNGDYDKTADEITKLQITKISEEVTTTLVSSSDPNTPASPPQTIKTITITTARPGMLIGKKAENLEALKNHLSSTLGVTKVVPEESKENLIDWIIPVSHHEYDDHHHIDDDLYRNPMDDIFDYRQLQDHYEQDR